MDVSIVIPSHNGKRWLEICLPSIFDQNFKDAYEVILVENASSDDTIDYVSRNFPQVRIVEATRNLGYADGCNEGVRHAQGRYVIILNNDVKLESGWLSALVRAAERHPEYHLLGSVDQFGIKRDFNVYLEIASREIVNGSDFIVPSLFMSGACFLTRSDWIKEHGRLFESYFYFEDAELSLRSILLGANIGYVTSSKFQHFSRLEHSIRSPSENRRKLRTMMRFSARHKIKSMYSLFSLSDFIKLMCIHLLYLLILCFSRGDPILNLERIRGTLEGIPEIGMAVGKRRDFQVRKRRTDRFVFQRLLYTPTSIVQSSFARLLLG